MLLAVQQFLLGRMREPVASRGIPIGVFAINRVARMQACCQIVGLFADRSVAHRAHAAERTLAITFCGCMNILGRYCTG